MAVCIRRTTGTLCSLHCNAEIADSTVASLERRGWAKDVGFFDDHLKWRWHWFTITDAGRALPEVVAEVARLQAQDDAQAAKWNAMDDEEEAPA